MILFILIRWHINMNFNAFFKNLIDSRDIVKQIKCIFIEIIRTKHRYTLREFN